MELDEFDFVVKHRPGKSQTYVDALSCLLMGASDDKETIGINGQIELTAEVQKELCQINEATQEAMPAKKNVVRFNGYNLDVNRCIMVGPFATQHLMEVLHNTSASHMGSCKLLACIKDCYTYNHDRHFTEAVTRTYEGCQQGPDYRLAMGKVMAE